MGRTIWQEVAAEQITVGDVLQWGTDGRVRVVDVEDRSADDRILEPVRVITVAGPTDRFERYAGIRNSMFVRPLGTVVRMDPERAAVVANTNLRSVTKSDAEPTDLRAEMRAVARQLSEAVAAVDSELEANEHPQTVLERLTARVRELESQLDKLTREEVNT